MSQKGRPVDTKKCLSQIPTFQWWKQMNIDFFFHVASFRGKWSVSVERSTFLSITYLLCETMKSMQLIEPLLILHNLLLPKKSIPLPSVLRADKNSFWITESYLIHFGILYSFSFLNTMKGKCFLIYTKKFVMALF